MNNTRFATVIHILTLLVRHPDKWLNSDLIAGSININPVIVRKELGVLQEQGWVATRKGKEGGAALAVPAHEITLAAIYQVLKNTDVLGKKHLHPNVNCPIGKEINAKLEDLYGEADKLLISMLKKKTLKEFAGQF